MLEQFLAQARNDMPVYLPDVRAWFDAEGTRPLHIHVKLYDGSVRRFALKLPETAREDEETFVASYVHALLYNILSSLGAAEIALYFDPADTTLCTLVQALDAVFQVRESKYARMGYGKALNVNERTLAVLTDGETAFAFRTGTLAEEPTVAPPAAITAAAPVFAQLPAVAGGKMILGMDIGGTDIKLIASVDGAIAACKEFDWFPAAFSDAEQLIDPILLVVRLMRAAASLCAANRADALDADALNPHADFAQMERGIAAMEQAAGGNLRNFDAIGLCFPDVVIRNRIVGGETYKTRGMRENPARDYESQFAKISKLNDLLAEYVTPDGAVMNTNDGPMAAFTAAVEQAAGGADVSKGFFAHTLGTELGTGWVLPNGTIPEIPLEVYNFIIDLGSFGQMAFDADDVRSVNNFNTLLPGTLQKYTCQSGVFRLGAKYLPVQDPMLMQTLLERGLFVREGDKLLVPTEPVDMRKPCLTYFMEQAAQGHKTCEEIFRQVGEFLAVTWQETNYILTPEAQERTLFGRLVKEPRCFALMCEGAARRAPNLRQLAADSDLANTPLMQQLAAHPDYTVAQFAQAVGAVYYACVGLL